MKSTLLLTGATGFVGSALARRLVRNSRFDVIAAVRREAREVPDGVGTCRVRDLLPSTDWAHALIGVNVVVHAAARVHATSDTAPDQLAEFRKVNVEGTLRLARQAAVAGVGRFVFVSSIKVNGEATIPDHPFRADDPPAPLDAYGVSKMEAEQGLRGLAGQTSMEVAIVRPPLVYGPGVKANFRALMQWLRRGVPLPLGSIHNRRSLVALDNLVDLLAICADHPAAANQTFLVSDNEDLSTTELVRRLGHALGKPARLIRVPAALLEMGAGLVRKPEIAQRLCGWLQVDISSTRNLLGWAPPVTVDEGLKMAAEGFLREAPP